MDIRIVANTKPQDGMTEEALEELKIYCGINAGISQCKETYLDANIQDRTAARRRFDTVIRRGHMSVADHAMVGVVFENASRMMAMVMNSLRFHATTEKSGRYTEMTGGTEEQCALYDKWNAIFKGRILALYPDYNDAFIAKQLKARGLEATVENGKAFGHDGRLSKAMEEIYAMPSLPSNTRSQENARYVLSIFTKSTVFSYTASLSQWNYIYDWCGRYTCQFEKREGELFRITDGTQRHATPFEAGLYEDLTELAEFILNSLYVPHLRDHKKRCFSMLTTVADENHPMGDFTDADSQLGFSYTKEYKGSFILLSHLHRHRTIQYWMRLDDNAGFYVPKPIRGTGYEQEWLNDLEGIRHLYPQGMLVSIVEAGTLDAFTLKASERLCGCAMLETMENVRSLALEFAALADSGKATPMELGYIGQFYDLVSGRLKTKDKITDGCREGCYFGCQRALDRTV